MNAAIANQTVGGLTLGRETHPAAADFAVSLKKWIAPETILLESVDADHSGIIDLVLVGSAGTIGIQFDSRAIDRPVPYFVDHLFLMSPLDVIDSEIELLYILMKSMPMLFTERGRHQLTRQARMDRFNFTKPESGRLSSYEINSSSRRKFPLVLRVLGGPAQNRPLDHSITPAAA